MSFPGNMCVIFPSLLAFLVVPKIDALIINYFDTPSMNPFNSSLMQSLYLEKYKKVIPAGFIDYGIGVYKMHKEPLSWGKAMKVCEGEGAHLAIVNSQQEEDVLGFIFSKVVAAEIKGAAGPDHVATGVHDLFNEGEYVTVQGKPIESVGFVHWQAGDPNGGTKENCLVMHRTGALYDTDCSLLWAYICELN